MRIKRIFQEIVHSRNGKKMLCYRQPISQDEETSWMDQSNPKTTLEQNCTILHLLIHLASSLSEHALLVLLRLPDSLHTLTIRTRLLLDLRQLL